MRLGRRLVAGLAVMGAMAASVTGAHADDRFEYVAMGDSAAAGPFVPHQDINLLCLRSDRNYPAVAAKALGAVLTDVSCSGATTEHLATRQFGVVRAQYEALKPSTDLVSLTIGANDLDLFTTALSCVNVFPEPLGVSCHDRMTADGRDTMAEAVAAWAPTFGAVIDEIRSRAPHARIVVTGYGTYIREGGCYPRQPVWARDADYLQGVMNRLSAAIRAEAEKRGAVYVDFAAITVGHDICAPWDERYLEGLVPTDAAAPLHPNAKGMAAFGAAVAAAAR
ncbi:SGNH/GDSL hydrolase family protein [Actinokineospora fastidiosa]|uniref:Hydrolase n=1 Tax=Actinokineospora fastidiosa TaxID=1816 RepID=A0A918LK07_9PSEU|nr:SGNH/GDSL hydrolase family protein [Actinokineospora fastidiosa]GGS58312.1 hydrolase [Actinokineospora fastidiosa]